MPFNTFYLFNILRVSVICILPNNEKYKYFFVFVNKMKVNADEQFIQLLLKAKGRQKSSIW